MNAGLLRLLLAVYLVAMDILAMLYLRRRSLILDQYAAWGLFAILVPAPGPFLVIKGKPGGPLHDRRSRTITRRWII